MGLFGIGVPAPPRHAGEAASLSDGIMTGEQALLWASVAANARHGEPRARGLAPSTRRVRCRQMKGALDRALCYAESWSMPACGP